MKKILLLFISVVIISCSKDDGPIDNGQKGEVFNIPSWAQGDWSVKSTDVVTTYYRIKKDDIYSDTDEDYNDQWKWWIRLYCGGSELKTRKIDEDYTDDSYKASVYSLNEGNKTPLFEVTINKYLNNKIIIKGKLLQDTTNTGFILDTITKR